MSFADILFLLRTHPSRQISAGCLCSSPGSSRAKLFSSSAGEKSRQDALKPFFPRTQRSLFSLQPRALHPRTKRFIELYPDRITYYDRRFSGPAELYKMDMVLTALDDPSSSRQIVELCREQRIPVNAADIPDLCDFYFGAQIRDGPLQIMISTNGSGPRIAALLKSKLSAALGGYEGEAIRRVGELRVRLKERAPGIGGAVSRRRMKWMSQLCNEWDMEDLTQLDDAMIARLLDEGWERNRVPSLHDVGGKPKVKQGKDNPHPHGSSTVLPATLGFIVGGVSVALLLMYHRR
ncbi:uncharacterized protein EV420DRAFT_1521064 [Desarmillaria tabescens]|uniref:precorrin-2 dehydrogenase n=1 Tax=Armillaria tabescens TaxID=1929756 RepID=A0AA39NE59_ARMTA|nr:uncharacterized protein EV420DRAFT_1521064 [Desarmillaria tabescens]KAK0463996.1 hypothetical protein EV420DRAFT_1521064 [Desarmillaria tabescens]